LGTLISGGTFTCGMLADGSIETYSSVTAIAINSGGFKAARTFLGGFAPSADICSGGCGVQVIGGVTLSTTDLNGVLNLKITSITVAIGAIFQLGTPGASTGFKFKFPIKLSILGVSIEIFDPLTGFAIGPLQALGTLISGGTFTLTISASGSVTIGGTAGRGTTTEMPFSTSMMG
ncbi:unnamed protein product, partial [Rotaria socialis]